MRSDAPSPHTHTSHTHTHIHTHTHTHTHTHAHTHTHMHTHTHAHTHHAPPPPTHTHTLTPTHTHSYPPTLTYTLTPAHNVHDACPHILTCTLTLPSARWLCCTDWHWNEGGPADTPDRGHQSEGTQTQGDSDDHQECFRGSTEQDNRLCSAKPTG